MRLIDADRLLAEIKTLPIMSNWGETFFPHLVQDQLTVDAVPVIRCKDCAYFGLNDENVPYCLNPFGLDDPEPSGFCNYGV